MNRAHPLTPSLSPSEREREMASTVIGGTKSVGSMSSHCFLCSYAAGPGPTASQIGKIEDEEEDEDEIVKLRQKNRDRSVKGTTYW